MGKWRNSSRKDFNELLATLTDKQVFALKIKLLERRRTGKKVVGIKKGMSMPSSSCISYVNFELKKRGIVVKKGVIELKYLTRKMKRWL